VGCVGANTQPTTQSCSNISLKNFYNPLDLANKASTVSQKEQCVWCDYYYQDSASTTTSGKRGNMDFQFTYSDLTGKPMKSYSMIMTYSVLDPNTSTIPANQKIEFTTNLAVPSNSPVNISGIYASRSVSQITGRAVPYNGQTYRWWIKATNSANESSLWISADRNITVPDHQWPKPAVGGIIPTYSATNALLGHTVCSTMADVSTRYKIDPCYRACWQDLDVNGNFLDTKPIVGDPRWKCSVCYSVSGVPVTCGAGSFEWKDIPANIGTFNNSTNTYKLNKNNQWKGDSWVSNSGKTFFNPIIRFNDPTSQSNLLKLKIYGSECPIEASVNAKSIRPIWIE
jgi:hypothetical protein